MNPLGGHLLRMFGRPRGHLGRLGGRLMAGEGKRAVAEWALSTLAFDPSDRVREVGFGPGPGTEAALAAVPAGDVVGVDYSHEMVAMARERNAAAIEAGRADLRYGAASDLPFPDGAVDGAFSVNSMQVWPDAVAGLAELRRVTKPGGRVAVVATPAAGQSIEVLEPHLREAGFEAVQVLEGEHGTCAVGTV